MLIAPPLSLYIHIPWCVEKCPYCDFNSHALKHAIPEQDYISQLLLDLDSDITRFKLNNRPLHSIFIGGGTPSLFSAPAIEQLLTQVLQRFEHKVDIEITLEANPGTVEADKFIGFFNGGVSRLSVGVQSFASDKLIKLGRIHDSEQAKVAAKLAHECGVKSFNLDLMHGLPEQTVAHALDDLKTAISLNPSHISWYQLTIEPNTAFHSRPPKLPQDEVLWNIQDQGIALLNQAGYQQYEISAYSKPEFQCQHNLNYWKFGDYLGIGCGAHGKITDVEKQTIYRTVKVKHPKGYLDISRKALDKLHTVSNEELPFEYMMNRLRLFSGFSLDEYQAYTGLSINSVLPILLKAQDKNLMEFNGTHWSVSTLGHRYLNDLLEMFL
ncbi:radical SAM family heme chaperone HemW [Colwellia sp. MB02u-18]|uniref:radical SAM family heme chaperone HemW n=1 Tax=unclassified Colwellia TaxID=196834 RepID=UPI0015F44699|nr:MULTISPECIES: radical SAM family heme chaperone HemW [unclassified Colwellia]MBA6223988.1 radical SAM family heme chaperone HemW [Colwellia sp. MB3u-45]MBA6266549.1 radical SAM family heme chaperone HemW [Colwellia sp. MB3u-43]MBA6320169.1 radical SAM family heme chaperone HemW [Colwellia sp. MB02u-19]MBA6325980.1 radical SAM family heme chaperone HemW [Colwellia sp. MB02u-18]MBA6332623.1 radical SAM family heme chaperone HemW [Colwellia sp. MB02u-12]